MLESIHNKHTFRELYHNYGSEMLFGLVLFCLLALSFQYDVLIPFNFYVKTLNPTMNSCIMAICLFGAWLVFRHHSGIHVRILWGYTLLVWAVLSGLLVLRVIVFHEPFSADVSLRLHGRILIVGNFFAWTLFHYPVAVLRPGWLTVRRSLMALLPVAVVALANELLPIDLRWLLAIWPMVWVAQLGVHIRKYRQWCEDNYSSMDNIDVQWIVRYIIMYLFAGLGYVVMSFHYNPCHAFTQQCLLLLILAYSTEQILFRQDPWNLLRRAEATKAAMEEYDTEDADGTKIDNPDLMNEEYRAAIDQWMKTEKPYLNPKFCLTDLREVIPLNRTYLSQFIKNTYNCSFYQFVTNYRIEEAKRLMRENPWMRIQDVSEQCGFSSSTVFGRIFAKETGVTPREWFGTKE